MKVALATRCGHLLDLEAPQPDTIDLNDIAMGLARAMRFGNQTDMSVAQHSVNVMLVVQALGGDRRAQRSAIFHDASEYILTDMPRPVKKVLPEYYVIEDRLMAAIAAKFDFDWPCPSIVKRADEMMLVTEAVEFMHQNIKPYITPEYGFPANLQDFIVPEGRWFDYPLGKNAAAQLFLDHAIPLLGEENVTS